MKDLTYSALVGWRILLFFNMIVCAYSGRVGWMLFWAIALVAVFPSTEKLKAGHSAIKDEKSPKA